MADADVVLVNGGINDVDIRFILNPFTDKRQLVHRTGRHCYGSLKVLLTRALAAFPRARIVVTSYYPVLSEDSHVPFLSDFLATLGVPIDPAFRLLEQHMDRVTILRVVFTKVVRNCRIFHEESTAGIQRAVAETTGPDGRVRAALVPFTVSPEDPMAAERHQACDLFETDIFQREGCYRASAGHPNQRGAEAYADAILAAL